MFFLIFSTSSNSIQQNNNDLINYSNYKEWTQTNNKIKNFASLMLELCKRLRLNLLQIHHNGNSEFLISTEDLFIDHFLKILCVLWVKNTFKVVYYPVPKLESLHLISLYAHHNFDLHSQVGIIH